LVVPSSFRLDTNTTGVPGYSTGGSITMPTTLPNRRFGLRRHVNSLASDT
jgi:hypothetical protein